MPAYHSRRERTAYQQTTGTVTAAHKQWWLKVNTKPIRRHAWDGALFPFIIDVEYTAGGIAYSKEEMDPCRASRSRHREQRAGPV